MPAAELRDRPMTVEHVWDRRASGEPRERLAAATAATSPHEMLTLLEDELLRRLRATAGLPPVRHTSAVLAATAGAVAIGELSATAGVSRTYLAQRFTDVVGLTPKRLARTYRFAAAVRAIDAAGPVDWSEVAHRAGFYDQAHFGNELRACTGMTPTQYLGVRRRFLREHAGHPLDVGPLPAA
jgi:AraC-like DNA-binding protein